MIKVTSSHGSGRKYEYLCSEIEIKTDLENDIIVKLKSGKDDTQTILKPKDCSAIEIKDNTLEQVYEYLNTPQPLILQHQEITEKDIEIARLQGILSAYESVIDKLLKPNMIMSIPDLEEIK